MRMQRQILAREGRVAGLLAVVGLLVAGIAAAQEQPGRPPGRFGQFLSGFPGRGGIESDVLPLLRSPQVRAELKVTEEEQAFLQMVEENVQKKRQELFGQMRDLSPEARQERFRNLGETVRAQAADTEKQVAEVIGADRLGRLKQIQLQLAGPAALFDGRRVEELGISDEQRDRIRDAVQQVEAELRQTRRRLVEEKLQAVFTEDQKSKWSAMKGKPIDFDVDLRPDFPGPGPAGPDGQRRPGAARPPRTEP